MKTILQSSGHIMLPTKVRREKKPRDGDKFGILADADEPGALPRDIEWRAFRRRPATMPRNLMATRDPDGKIATDERNSTRPA